MRSPSSVRIHTTSRTQHIKSPPPNPLRRPSLPAVDPHPLSPLGLALALAPTPTPTHTLNSPSTTLAHPPSPTTLGHHSRPSPSPTPTPSLSHPGEDPTGSAIGGVAIEFFGDVTVETRVRAAPPAMPIEATSSLGGVVASASAALGASGGDGDGGDAGVISIAVGATLGVLVLLVGVALVLWHRQRKRAQRSGTSPGRRHIHRGGSNSRAKTGMRSAWLPPHTSLSACPTPLPALLSQHGLDRRASTALLPSPCFHRRASTALPPSPCLRRPASTALPLPQTEWCIRVAATADPCTCVVTAQRMDDQSPLSYADIGGVGMASLPKSPLPLSPLGTSSTTASAADGARSHTLPSPAPLPAPSLGADAPSTLGPPSLAMGFPSLNSFRNFGAFSFNFGSNFSIGLPTAQPSSPQESSTAAASRAASRLSGHVGLPGTVAMAGGHAPASLQAGVASASASSSAKEQLSWNEDSLAPHGPSLTASRRSSNNGGGGGGVATAKSKPFLWHELSLREPPLGSGAFGDVWMCSHAASEYAVKRLRPEVFQAVRCCRPRHSGAYTYVRVHICCTTGLVNIHTSHTYTHAHIHACIHACIHTCIHIHTRHRAGWSTCS